MTIDYEIAQHIAEVVPDMKLGGNVFVGPVRPFDNAVPKAAVFVLLTGGNTPLLQFEGESHKSSTVQIRTRHQSYAEGMALSMLVYNAVQLQTFGSLLGCSANHSDPLWVGPDANGLYQWSLNFTVFY